MRKLSEQSRKKTAAVTEYLNQYSVAKESAAALNELNIHVLEDITNPSINGRGYCSGNSNKKSEGAASPIIHSENINPFCKEEASKIKALMDEITSALGKLEMSRGKTILMKNFLSGLTEREICRTMKISHDTYYQNRRRAMLQLYDILIESDLIDPV